MMTSTRLFARRLVPLLDRVIIRKCAPMAQTSTGILLPEISQVIQRGEIISVGPGSREYRMSLAVGDRVILPSFGGQQVHLEDETVHIYREQDIPAKISE
jgi:chaperonin GroES